MHLGLQYQVLLLKKIVIALKEGLKSNAEITCSKISVSGLENLAQPVQPLFEVPHILSGEICTCDRIEHKDWTARKGTWVRAMMSSCSTRWDSALPSELTLHKNVNIIVR